MEKILQYFPKLTAEQKDHFSRLGELYKDWNQKINVISRKDIDQLYVHHVLHSLSISKFMPFAPGTRVLDLGTGGGFPGIPLAILYPETHFTLIDGTRKKITVVNEVATALGLKNVTGMQMRVEELKDKFDFVVTRAVAKMDKLREWSFPLIELEDHKNIFPNGIIALKGGNIKAEMKELPKKSYYEIEPITHWFDEPHFEEKVVVYLQR